MASPQESQPTGSSEKYHLLPFDTSAALHSYSEADTELFAQVAAVESNQEIPQELQSYFDAINDLARYLLDRNSQLDRGTIMAAFADALQSRRQLFNRSSAELRQVLISVSNTKAVQLMDIMTEFVTSFESNIDKISFRTTQITFANSGNFQSELQYIKDRLEFIRTLGNSEGVVTIKNRRMRNLANRIDSFGLIGAVADLSDTFAGYPNAQNNNEGEQQPYLATKLEEVLNKVPVVLVRASTPGSRQLLTTTQDEINAVLDQMLVTGESYDKQLLERTFAAIDQLQTAKTQSTQQSAADPEIQKIVEAAPNLERFLNKIYRLESANVKINSLLLEKLEEELFSLLAEGFVDEDQFGDLQYRISGLALNTATTHQKQEKQTNQIDLDAWKADKTQHGETASVLYAVEELLKKAVPTYDQISNEQEIQQDSIKDEFVQLVESDDDSLYLEIDSKKMYYVEAYERSIQLLSDLSEELKASDDVSERKQGVFIARLAKDSSIKLKIIFKIDELAKQKAEQIQLETWIDNLKRSTELSSVQSAIIAITSTNIADWDYQHALDLQQSLVKTVQAFRTSLDFEHLSDDRRRIADEWLRNIELFRAQAKLENYLNTYWERNDKIEGRFEELAKIADAVEKLQDAMIDDDQSQQQMMVGELRATIEDQFIILAAKMTGIDEDELYNINIREEGAESTLNSIATRVESGVFADQQSDRMRVYVSKTFSTLIDPIRKVVDQLESLLGRYNQANSDPNFDNPPTTEEITRLRTDVSFYKSVLTSKEFKKVAHIFSKLHNYDAVQSLLVRIDEVDIDTEFYNLVKEQELDTLPPMRLAQLIVKLNINPFLFGESRKGIQSEYNAAVVKKVKDRLFNPTNERAGDSAWDTQERNRAYHWMAASFIDDINQEEGNAAAGTKTSVSQTAKGEKYSLETSLGSHLIYRDALIEATSMDPVIGQYFSYLVESLRAQVALKDLSKSEKRNLSRFPTVAEAEQQLLSLWQVVEQTAQQLATAENELKKKRAQLNNTTNGNATSLQNDVAQLTSRIDTLKKKYQDSNTAFTIKNPMKTKNGQIVLHNGKFYHYNPAYSYNALINETRGRAALYRFIEEGSKLQPGEKPELKSIVDKLSSGDKKYAHDMVGKLYCGLTFLDDSFWELQASTQTRGHNAGEKDLGMLIKPWTSSVHSVLRYSKLSDASIATTMPFDTHTYPDYYFGDDKAGRKYLEKAHLYREHQETLYNTEFCFGNLPMPGFLQQQFPDSTVFVTPLKDENETFWTAIPEKRGKKSSEYQDDEYTHRLVDVDHNVLFYMDNQGRVYTADSRLVGKFVDSPDRDGQPTGFKLKGFFRYLTGDKKGTVVSVEDATFEGVSIKQKNAPNAMYYTGMRGIKKVMETVFAKIPGGLTDVQIVEAKGESESSSLLNDLLSSGFGQLKMFPNYAIKKLVEPYLTFYCLRLIQAYKFTGMGQRTRLVKTMIEELTRISNYGGLSGTDIREQIDKVVKNLVTFDAPEPGLDSYLYKPFEINLWDNESPVTVWPRQHIMKYTNYRDDELLHYLEELWHEEHSDETMPPLGTAAAASMNRTLKEWFRGEVLVKQWSPAQKHFIEMSKREASVPPPLVFSEKLQVEKKEDKH